MVYRTAPIGGDREETGDGSLSPPQDEQEESRVREEETDDIYAVKGI